MKNLAAIAVVAVLPQGCGAGIVELQGVVVDGPGDGAAAVAAEVSVFDETGELFATASAEPSGWFRVDAPMGETVFIEVAGPGLVPASFTGVTGLDPRFRIPNGEVFAVTEDAAAAWRGRFAGCPGLDRGPFVTGEVRILELADEASGEHPLVTKAYAIVGEEDDAIEGCYLDAEGVAYDPMADRSGDSGAFLVPDVPVGVHSLTIGYDVFDTYDAIATWPIRVPEGGVVPRFPAYVSFALL